MLYSAAIPCFLEVAREQNISRAAKNMFISPQAVSKQIQRLEQEVGTLLFYRNRNQLTLTPAGRLYYAHFTETMKNLAEVQTAVAALPTGDEIIRIGCVKGLSIEVEISDLMSACTALPPTVHVLWGRDEPNKLLWRLQDNDFDIIISYHRDVEFPEVESMHFLTSEFCLVAGKSMPEFELMWGMKSINSVPFLTWKLDGSTETHSRKGFQKLCETCGFAPENVLMLPDMESMHTAIEMGSGATIASRHDRLCMSKLVNVFPLGVNCDLSIAWRKNEPRIDIRMLVEDMKRILEEKQKQNRIINFGF
ncbi:MAG: LysR family transcriptional regulator [Oscillospiraceae bacterium]|jgi:DNA-binding transcriptional LysR family regulator